MQRSSSIDPTFLVLGLIIGATLGATTGNALLGASLAVALGLGLGVAGSEDADGTPNERVEDS